MAKVLFSDSMLWVNSSDLSNFLTNITLNYGAESQDRTTMGQDTRIAQGGLKTASIDFEMAYDTVTGPESVLWALVGTTSCVQFRDVNSCASASNPDISGVMTLMPLNRGGAVGDLLKISGTFAPSSSLTRAASS